MTASANVAVAKPGTAKALHSTAVNFGVVSVSELLLRCANFGLAVFIARAFSPGVLGNYAEAIAISTCAVTISDAGLQLAAIRRVSESRADAAPVASRFVSAKVMLLPVAVAIACAGLLLEHDKTAPYVAALVFARVLLQSYSQLNFGILKGLSRVSAIGAIQFAHFALLTVTLGVLWVQRASLGAILAAAALCQGIEWAASALWLRGRGIHLRMVGLAECVRCVRDSVTVAVTSIIGNFVLRFDVLLVAAFAAPDVLGHYAAAQLPMTAMYLGAAMFGSVFLPELVERRRRAEEFDALVRSSIRWLLALTVPFTAALIAAAPLVIRTVFGPAYQSSVRLFVILLAATPFLWINSLLLHRAISVEDTRVHARFYGVATIIAIAIAAICGWRWSATGIAAAAALREAGLTAMLLTAGRRTQA